MSETTKKELSQEAKFKKFKSSIKSMYGSDSTIRHNVNRTASASVSFNTATASSIKSSLYNITTALENQRKLSSDAYIFSPIYANIIDYLSNMYLWRYCFYPRLIKNTVKNTNYEEIYKIMSEIVDGLNIETTFPQIITKLLVEGAVYLISEKNTSSQTITTMLLPYKYCRIAALTQFGTYQYQFDYSYFENLGLNGAELEQILEFYPAIIQEGYKAYLTDKNNLRWQSLDPKFSAAITTNEYGFPTRLASLIQIKNFETYQDNELDKNSQTLDKIITHQVPVWQDRLIIDIEEMEALHNGMKKTIQSNPHIKLFSSFGSINLLSVGEDTSKENKTLENARDTIYSSAGENTNLFNGNSVQALSDCLIKDSSIIWKYIENLVSYFNLVINNSFNFKNYQCDIQMLPITMYNENEKILVYKEAATLGVGKLEYIVSTGVKQVNIPSKIELENFLQLENLVPLSTSYTQTDNQQNAAKNTVDNSQTEEDNEKKKKKEQEVE